ncbi:MAG: hypothetical protein JSU72_19730, partial [Deltaproteobacteria bacterium]
RVCAGGRFVWAYCSTDVRGGQRWPGFSVGFGWGGLGGHGDGGSGQGARGAKVGRRCVGRWDRPTGVVAR